MIYPKILFTLSDTDGFESGFIRSQLQIFPLRG